MRAAPESRVNFEVVPIQISLCRLDHNQTTGNAFGPVQPSLEIGPPDWRYLILHVARSSPPVPTWLRWTGQCLARLQEGLVNISNGLNNSHPQIEYLDSHSQALQELLETPVFTVSRPRSVFCAPLSGQSDGTGNVTTGTLAERLG